MTYEIVPWKRAMSKLESQEADALLGEYETEDFLMPRYPLDIEPTSVVFKKEHVKTWDGVKSLEGKKVAWPRGYDYHTTSELENINLEWYEVDNITQAWKMLEKDRIDFYMDDGDDMDHYIESQNVDMAPYQKEIIWTKNLYIVFAKSKKAENLIELYDNRILELLESGELKKFFEEWEATFPSFEPRDE
jgi:polar amino acid transport system substrate-binding protein